MAEKKPVAKKVVVKKVVAKKAATRKPKVSAALQLAQVAARAADEKQGSNITVLNVGDVLAITELFVVRLQATRARWVQSKARSATKYAKNLVGHHCAVKERLSSSGY
jgi:ribosomal silencing factor RsfS